MRTRGEWRTIVKLTSIALGRGPERRDDIRLAIYDKVLD